MSTMKVAVNGRLIFNWDADEAAIANILEAYPRGARSTGITPEDLADASIVYLAKDASLIADPVGQEMQMMGVVWRILTADTDNADRPGKVSAYAANTDFNVNIEIAAGSYTVRIDARSKYDS